MEAMDFFAAGEKVHSFHETSQPPQAA